VRVAVRDPKIVNAGKGNDEVKKTRMYPGQLSKSKTGSKSGSIHEVQLNLKFPLWKSC